MKKAEQQNTVFPYREVRKLSPIPFLIAGIFFLLYGIIWPMASFWSYLGAAAVAAIAFLVGRLIFPDKKERIDLPPDTGDNNTNQLLAEAREQLAGIRASNDLIADAKISATIDNIESTCMKILSRLQENPELYGQLRTFMRYYLPTTRKLLDSRAAIEQSGNKGENATLVRQRTDRVLPEIEKAFSKQLEALDKHKYLDIQVEMDVLEGMLKSDGLTDQENEGPKTTQI